MAVADAPALPLLHCVALSDATDALGRGLEDEVAEKLAERVANEGVACETVGLPDAAALSVSAEALGRAEREGEAVGDALDVTDRVPRLLAEADGDAAALRDANDALALADTAALAVAREALGDRDGAEYEATPDAVTEAHAEADNELEPLAAKDGVAAPVTLKVVEAAAENEGAAEDVGHDENDPLLVG